MTYICNKAWNLSSKDWILGFTIRNYTSNKKKSLLRDLLKPDHGSQL